MSTFADYIDRTEPGKSDKHVENRLNDMFGRGFNPLKVHRNKGTQQWVPFCFIYNIIFLIYKNFIYKYYAKFI